MAVLYLECCTLGSAVSPPTGQLEPTATAGWEIFLLKARIFLLQFDA